jgi:dTMP kinase
MLIAIEGIDGSGKGTQAALLATRAKEAGMSIATFSFPGYAKNAFGEAVGRYLNGEYGDVDAVAPQLASLLYAGDRFATRAELENGCRASDLVICDRYVPSNLAHQAAKLPPAQRPTFIAWLTNIEYGIYRVPKADLVIYLDVPVELASGLVLRKKSRDYTQLKADIHEKNVGYLHRCREVYQFLANEHHGGPWVRIPCTNPQGDLIPPDQISAAIWQIVSECAEKALGINRISP